MTTRNDIVLDFDTGADAAPAAQPFMADIGGYKFRRAESADARRARFANIEEMDEQLEYWQQFFRWLAGETSKFENFFRNPAEHYQAVGITLNNLSDTFTAANALAAGYALNWPVGEDKLKIEPSKITVTTGDEYPKQGILAAVALAMKNPAYANAEGVTITAEDPELLAFAYAAFKAAGFKVKNEADITASLNEAGTKAWTDLAAEEPFKNAMADFPELKERFDAAAAAQPAAAIDLDERPEVLPQTLGAIVETVQPYVAPEGIPHFKANNAPYPNGLTKEDLLEFADGKKNATDVRALASVGLYFDADAQEQAIVGQMVTRALSAVIHYSNDDAAFLGYLKSELGIEESRAQELTSKLREPLAAYIDNLKDSETGKLVLSDLKASHPDFAAAIAALVDSEQNRVLGVPESFTDTGALVAKVLDNPKFGAWVTRELETKPEVGRLPPAGPIAKKMGFDNGRKVGEKPATTEGGKPTPVFTDFTYEGAQMLFAAYRSLAMPADAVRMTPYDKLASTIPPFPVGRDGSFVDGVLKDAVGSQYAAYLLRAAMGAKDGLPEDGVKSLDEVRWMVAYLTAREAKAVLEAELAQTPDEKTQIRSGISRTLDNLNAVEDAAREKLDENAIHFDFDIADKVKLAEAKAKLIGICEYLYLKAAEGKGISAEALDANITHLSRFRQHTEVISLAPHFADDERFKPEAVQSRAPQLKNDKR